MSPRDQPLRLVKLLMPADVVRQMDHTILAAGGAYQGRGDFITDAVRDRIAEEMAMRSAAVTRDFDTAGGKSAARAEVAGPDLVAFGTWIETKPPTVAGSPTSAISFGLHNRDLPTLWAFDQLVEATSKAQQPVSWADFVASVGRASTNVGEWLRIRDLSRERGISVGTGFPKPGAKQSQSVDRFIGAMVGSLRRGDGPLFDLGLAVGLTDQALAPTEAGVDVLRRMTELGLAVELPQPEGALRAWWGHLAMWAPAEHSAWLRVLQAVAQAPTREDLIARFVEDWPGSTADTNIAGFVSRSREWGLIEPELIDSRYRLTALGEAVAGEK